MDHRAVYSSAKRLWGVESRDSGFFLTICSHLHVACWHLREGSEAPRHTHELSGDGGAYSGAEVGRDFVHARLDECQDSGLVAIQCQCCIAALQYLGTPYLHKMEDCWDICTHSLSHYL